MIKDRLQRTAAGDDFTYTFESNWKILHERIEGYNEDSDEESPGYFDPDVVQEAITFAENDFNETNELLNQLLGEEIGVDGVKVSFTLNEDGYAYTTISSPEELDSEQIEKVKDYMAGQFSDGWGEGLEQHSFNEDSGCKYVCAEECMSFERWCANEGIDTTDMEEEEIDECYVRYQNEEIDVEYHYDYYVKLWPNDFEIRLV